MDFLIWSFEHKAWWAQDAHGYVRDIDRAGRYDAAEAGRIVTDSVLLDEVAILERVAQHRGAPSYHPYGGLVGVEAIDD